MGSEELSFKDRDPGFNKFSESVFETFPQRELTEDQIQLYFGPEIASTLPRPLIGYFYQIPRSEGVNQDFYDVYVKGMGKVGSA